MVGRGRTPESKIMARIKKARELMENSDKLKMAQIQEIRRLISTLPKTEGQLLSEIDETRGQLKKIGRGPVMEIEKEKIKRRIEKINLQVKKISSGTSATTLHNRQVLKIRNRIAKLPFDDAKNTKKIRSELKAIEEMMGNLK